MDRLVSLKVFVKIAETGSFTKAGEILGLPKASISAYLQDLEEEIGARLFNRTTRKVILTHEGESFLEKSLDLLANVDELENMFKNEQASIRGKVRIDMPVGFSKNILMPHLKKFIEKHPDIEIELSTTDRKVDVVSEGFDIVLRVGTLADSSLIVKKVGALRMINCASRDYIKKYGNPKSIEELKDHKLIHYSSNLTSNYDGFEYFDGNKYRNIKMKGNLVVNNTETYTRACLAGLGIIQVPFIGVKNYLKKGELVEILPKLRSEPMTVSLLYPHRKNIPKRTLICLEWLTEMMGEYLED